MPLLRYGLSFPQTDLEIDAAKQECQKKYHIPAIIGSFDCTHVKIKTPMNLAMDILIENSMQVLMCKKLAMPRKFSLASRIGTSQGQRGHEHEGCWHTKR